MTYMRFTQKYWREKKRKEQTKCVSTVQQWVRELFVIRSKFNSQNDCRYSENEPGNRSLDTDRRNEDVKNLLQDGAQEPQKSNSWMLD